MQTYGYKYIMRFDKAQEYGLFKVSKSIGDKLSNFISNDSDISNTIPRVSRKLYKKKQNDNYFYIGKSNKNKTGKTLVFVVGGITYDEIAELKKWNVPNSKIYIGSTNLTSGTQLVGSFIL